MTSADRSWLRVDAAMELPADAGRKAHGLRRIAAAGLRAPPSWVVMPEAGPDDLAALADTLRRDGLERLAVRSSALGEDDPRASFPGIHSTLLDVTIADLGRAVEHVARSPLSEIARDYRRTLGLAPATAPGAVVVQPFLRARAAGVAFDAQAGAERVVIEALRGATADPARDGATPELLEMERTDGVWEVRRRRRGTQSPATDIVSKARGEEIARGVLALRARAGASVDVEWIEADDLLWFVQERPQSRPLGDALESGVRWTRANLGEVLPEIPSALTRSLLPSVSGDGISRMLAEFGVTPPPPGRLFACVHGRPVFGDAMYSVADALHLPRDAVEADVGAAGTVGHPGRPVTLVRALAHPRISAAAVALGGSIERRVRACLDGLDVAGRRHPGVDLSTATPGDLLAHVRNHLLEPVRESAFVATCLYAILVWRQTSALHVLRRVPFPRAVLACLVAEGEGTVTTRELDDLLSVAAALRESEPAAEFVREITPAQARAETWRERLPPAVWARVCSWVAEHGHRGPWESDLASPRYGEDLRVLASMLFPLVRDAGAGRGDARRARRAESAARARADLRDLIGPFARWRLARLVGRLHALSSLREAIRDRTMAVTARAREILLVVGARLAARRQLVNASDVWHLSIDELEHAVGSPDAPAAAAVAREQARRAAWRRIEVPYRFASEEIDRFVEESRRSAGVGAVLRGDAVSPGVAEGRVCVLQSPAEGDALASGSILVTTSVEPSWAPLFARAGAIVVELGGTLSHAAIVAREYGVPCVANVRGASRALRSGDLVQVDGTRGEVLVLASRLEESGVAGT